MRQNWFLAAIEICGQKYHESLRMDVRHVRKLRRKVPLLSPLESYPRACRVQIQHRYIYNSSIQPIEISNQNVQILIQNSPINSLHKVMSYAPLDCRFFGETGPDDIVFFPQLSTISEQATSKNTDLYLFSSFVSFRYRVYHLQFKGIFKMQFFFFFLPRVCY